MSIPHLCNSRAIDILVKDQCVFYLLWNHYLFPIIVKVWCWINGVQNDPIYRLIFNYVPKSIVKDLWDNPSK